MLRHAAKKIRSPHLRVARHHRGGRRFNAAAASTSKKKKRGLVPDQLKGSGGETDRAAGGGAPPTAATSAAAAAAPPPIAGGGGGGGNNAPAAFLAIGGVVAVGGAYLYFRSMESGQKEEIHKDIEEIDDTAVVGEGLEIAVEEKLVEELRHRREERESGEEPAAAAAAAAAAPEPEKDPNRVVAIAVPAKMKNTEEVCVAGPFHPAGGHRVRGLAPAEKEEEGPTPAVDDSSVTERAIEQLRGSATEQAAEAVVASHQTAWSSAVNVDDLDSLTPSQLKARVVQLATEMKDRTKWEAVRLKEFLAMKEKETADK
jgi:mitofilin